MSRTTLQTHSSEITEARPEAVDTPAIAKVQACRLCFEINAPPLPWEEIGLPPFRGMGP
jgi:hypothetical protein